MSLIQSHSKNHKGFTLIEVLIALVILSIGLLGMAALQVDGLRSENAALMQNRAINLAADMADRIRANNVGTTLYALPNGTQGLSDDPPTNCASNDLFFPGCTSEELVDHDLYEWKQLIENKASTGLPGGNGTIAASLLAGSLPFYVITLEWQEKDETKSYQIRVTG